MAPAGVFSALATGYYHSCGVLVSSEISCWGANSNKRSTSKARAEKLAELAAATGVAPADVTAAIDWSEAAGPSSDGAGPSSDGDVDVDIEQPAVDPELRQRV